MKLELVNEALKATGSTIVIDLEDVMVTLGKKTLLFPVINSTNSEEIGYYITGDIYVGADTIVDTSKGAIGNPIEKISRACLVISKNTDLSSLKSDNLSEKDFRKIEVEAFHSFEKLSESNLLKKGKMTINGKKIFWSDKIDDMDFYVHLFNPEEFILIKNNETLVAISNEETEIVVCDKKKKSYIEVLKNEGVRISNNKGEVINTSISGGIFINGRHLSEIISNALRPISDIFNKKKY